MALDSHSLVSEFILYFSTFFALVNPLANTAIFMSFTENDDMETKKILAKKSLFTAFIVILVFAVGGQIIFDFFGISITAFRLTGGILLTSIGFNMLHGEKSAINTPTNKDKKSALEAKLSVAVSPLAVPIFAGPGAITTAMNAVASNGITGIVLILSTFAILCIITYAFFINGDKIMFFFGKNGINVITRLMGLLLSVMGVQMFILGLKALVNSLK